MQITKFNTLISKSNHYKNSRKNAVNLWMVFEAHAYYHNVIIVYL